MASPLSGALARQIDQAFRQSGLPLAGTLRREGESTFNADGFLVPGSPATYPMRGYVDDYSDIRRAQAGIPQGDRIAAIFGASVSVAPQIGDKVKYPGYDWMQIRAVTVDPAKALYECQAFEVGAPD